MTARLPVPARRRPPAGPARHGRPAYGRRTFGEWAALAAICVLVPLAGLLVVFLIAAAVFP